MVVDSVKCQVIMRSWIVVFSKSQQTFWPELTTILCGNKNHGKCHHRFWHYGYPGPPPLNGLDHKSLETTYHDGLSLAKAQSVTVPTIQQAFLKYFRNCTCLLPASPILKQLSIYLLERFRSGEDFVQDFF